MPTISNTGYYYSAKLVFTSKLCRHLINAQIKPTGTQIQLEVKE